MFNTFGCPKHLLGVVSDAPAPMIRLVRHSHSSLELVGGQAKYSQKITLDNRQLNLTQAFPYGSCSPVQGPLDTCSHLLTRFPLPREKLGQMYMQKPPTNLFNVEINLLWACFSCQYRKCQMKCSGVPCLAFSDTSWGSGCPVGAVP